MVLLLINSLLFKKSSILQELHNSGLESYCYFQMWYNISKTQFFHISTRLSLPNIYSLLFENTQLAPFPTLNIFSLSFNSKSYLHLSCFAKSASVILSALYRLHHLFSSAQPLKIYKDYVRFCKEYVSYIYGGSAHTVHLTWVDLKAFCFIAFSYQLYHY